MADQDAITTGVVEEMTAFEVADQLMVWRNTFRETSVNFDARLLKRAADLLEEMQHQINEHTDEKEAMLLSRIRVLRTSLTQAFRMQRKLARQTREAEKWKRKFLRLRFRDDTKPMLYNLIRIKYWNAVRSDEPYDKARYREEVEWLIKDKERLPLP